MCDGQCSRRGAADVRARTVWFGQVIRWSWIGNREPEPIFLARVYVCVACGFSECYAHPQELGTIARSPDWERVPPRQPYTGETQRLTSDS